MVLPEDFPYLQSFVINDAYAVQNLTVPVFEGPDFKHLILTGKNGSGKTTTLTELAGQIQTEQRNKFGKQKAKRLLSTLNRLSANSPERAEVQKDIDALSMVVPTYRNPEKRLQVFSDQDFIVVFYKAWRRLSVRPVKTVISDEELDSELAKEVFDAIPSRAFKQYLVNKKVAQAFDTLEGNKKGSNEDIDFFKQLQALMRRLLSDPQLVVEFSRANYEFFILLSDGRRITFNQLPGGYSAALSIVTDLLMRVDLSRQKLNNYAYDPCGFVFIDEPESHLHLEPQYQILPLLTELFPNLQFIVATHSPAVASSIKNATVFDLTTGEALGDEAAGSSYSELMLTHFGVKDEYSNVADDIITSINHIVGLPDAWQARQALLTLLEEKGRYMSPGLRLEIDAQLVGLE